MKPYDQEEPDFEASHQDFLDEQEAEREAYWATWLDDLPDWQFNAVCAAERQRGQAFNPIRRAKFLLIVMKDFDWYQDWNEKGQQALARLDG